MTNWKPNMKAVCIDGSDWSGPNGERGTGPVKGDIVKVSGIRRDKRWPVGLWLELVGYSGAFECNFFRPLLGDEQEALDAIEQEVKETELIPEPA